MATQHQTRRLAQFLRNPQRYIEARYLPPAVCKHVRMISRMGSRIMSYTHALYRASHTCMCIALVTNLYARRKRDILVQNLPTTQRSKHSSKCLLSMFVHGMCYCVVRWNEGIYTYKASTRVRIWYVMHGRMGLRIMTYASALYSYSNIHMCVQLE
jgi:hypothetical protein